MSASRSHHTHTALCRSLLKTCTCSLLGRKLLPASPGIAGHTSLQRKTMILLRILSHIPLCSGECGSYRRLARSMGECQQHMPVYWYGLNLRTSIRQMLRLAWQSHSTIRVPAECQHHDHITHTQRCVDLCSRHMRAGAHTKARWEC